MDWLPEGTFAECPYQIEIQPRIAQSYLLFLRFPFQPTLTVFVNPRILTRRAIFNFADDIRRYGYGDLQVTGDEALRYDSNLNGLIRLYLIENNYTMSIFAFCKEFFDVLLELAT